MNATSIPIQDCKLRLYSFVNGQARERVTTFLGGFKPEWNGEILQVLDWKLNPEAGTGRLTYQTRNDLYAPIHDDDFPIVTERTALLPPNRSKHWRWDEYSESWINSRTGERQKVY